MSEAFLSDATFTIRGQRTAASVGDPISYVAHSERTVDQGPVVLHLIIDGEEWMSIPVALDNPPWDVWGATLPGGTLYEAGRSTLRFTDAGNNVLAEGSIVVAP